jgi:hypothetical protein
MIIGLDPGRNLGVAFVAEDGRLERGEIILGEELSSYPLPEGAQIVVGGGTGSSQVQEVLHKRSLSFFVVDEKDTSLVARELYFKDHPPPLWLRLLPRGLWSPPRPIDDYAAYAIALRYLATKR